LGQKRTQIHLSGSTSNWLFLAIGIMHDRIKPERHSFVFDLMEPQRPVVDRSILKLVQEHSFSGADFMLQKDGVVRVNPELVKSIQKVRTADRGLDSNPKEKPPAVRRGLI